MNNRETEFNNILDECLDRLIFNGETMEQCLNDYSEMADDLKPLLETAIVTSTVTDLKPAPAFMNRARAEMQSVLRENEEKKRRSVFSFGWQRSLVTAMSVILAVFAVTGGTAAAASNSMPDNFLYPVKLATEKVQLAFTFTDLGKAEAFARLADKRVEEIVYLANREDPDVEKIDVLATNLNSNLLNVAVYSSKTLDGSLKVMVKGQENFITMATAEDTAAMERSAAEDSSDEGAETFGIMAAPEPTAETDKSDEAGREAETGIVVEQPEPEITVGIPPSALTVEPAAGASVRPENRRELLNTTVTEQAMSNLTRLYNLLRVVPPSVRPVIERAITLTEDGYNIAINSLY